MHLWAWMPPFAAICIPSPNCPVPCPSPPCCRCPRPTLLPLPLPPALQVLLALYFFLAGVAVSTGRMLWLLPLATAASAAVHWLGGAASQLALPFYRFVCWCWCWCWVPTAS